MATCKLCGAREPLTCIVDAEGDHDLCRACAATGDTFEGVCQARDERVATILRAKLRELEADEADLVSQLSRTRAMVRQVRDADAKHDFSKLVGVIPRRDYESLAAVSPQYNLLDEGD